jgi:hypothetical protein
MADNRQIKDGLGNIFTIRMKDISSGGDGTVQRSMVLATLQPIDYTSGGSFHRTFKSGALAAGLAAASPVFSFQSPSSTVYGLIRRVRLQAWSTGTGFTAGMAIFDIVMARAFTAQLTGGTAANLAGNNAKLRTSMASSQMNIMYANTAALTGGTFTADGGPGTTESWIGTVGPNANTPFTGIAVLFEKRQSDMPMLLANQEGFIINATVPATGTWAFAVACEWDEILPTNGGY